MRMLMMLKYDKDQASSRVRGFYVAEELKKRNISYKIIFGYKLVSILKFLLSFWFYNVVYFQKRYSRKDLLLIKISRLFGKKVIFDLDDSPYGVKKNTAIKSLIIKIMKQASFVTVGSKKLYDFAKKHNEKPFILHTPIKLKYYKIEEVKKAENSDFITVGWIGNGKNYKYDLNMLIDPFKELSQKYKLQIIIIGALKEKEIYDSFSGLTSNQNIELIIIDELCWKDPKAVPKAINKFDIGVYPLLDKSYNQYKCGFKALEYMALGVPVVASPVSETLNIIEDGKDGLFANNTKEWINKLEHLIKDKEFRKKIGENGRKKVEYLYTTKKFVDYLEEILS